MLSELYQNVMGEPEVLTNVLRNREEYFHALGKKYAGVKRIFVVGSGTSFHCGLSVRYAMEKLTGAEVTAAYPSVFLEMNNLPEKALCIGISQSGRSALTIKCLEKCKSAGWYTLAVSSNRPSPITEAAEDYVPLVVGIEHSASTKGYVVSMEILMLLALEIGLANGTASDTDASELIHALEEHVANLPVLFERSEQWINRNREEFLKMKQASILGYDVNYGTALEGALKLLEAVRIMVAGYDFEEWLHGAYNALTPESHIFVCAHEGHHDYYRRVEKLARTIAPYNDGHTYLIGRDEYDDPRCLSAPFSQNEYIYPLEYIVPFQMMIALLPEFKGINADRVLIPTFHQDVGSKVVLGNKEE